MGIRERWSAYCLIFVCISQTRSDWSKCAHIAECQCKWSSGKKTAACVSAGLKEIPHLASEIQVLDLHGNTLKTLKQDAFANIELLNLQRLNLSSTNLRELHPDAFRELRILIELDLSQNELIQLAPDTFRGNDRLRLLVLNDNPLTTLLAEQFPPLQHLKRLEISRCKLRAVHPFAFANLRALETIHIHQNLLAYLHHATFNLPVLKTLTLSDNPWKCDCRLKGFHRWFVDSSRNIGNEEVFCSAPESLAHISWRSIKVDDLVCPPTVVTSPAVIRTEAGADISFGCFVQGDPKPAVTWSFRHFEIYNNSNQHSEILVINTEFNNFDEYQDDFMNKSAQWVNVTINNVTSDLCGEWKCSAKNVVGEAKSYLTLFLPKARAATARVAPDYTKCFLVLGAMLAMAFVGLIAAIVCWKTRRRVPPSRSFTDQEKKLLDTSLAVSCDRTSAEMGSSYAFEMLDRSMSLDSEDTAHVEPVQITIEGPPGTFPPPPAEFALPAPYGNIFISVHVSDHNEKYPDLLGGGSTLPRRSRTCILKPTYDNMGPRITAAGSSTWSLPGSNVDNTEDTNTDVNRDNPLTMPFSTFSTEFTAL